MTKSFRPWCVDEDWLLTPSVQEFVPAGHPAHLTRDIVREELDLSAILSTYTEARGFRPYHPGMIVALQCVQAKEMSYERMVKAENELAAEVQTWLDKAGEVDATEDAEHGADRRGEETPDWMADKQQRFLMRKFVLRAPMPHSSLWIRKPLPGHAPSCLCMDRGRHQA